MIIIELLLLIFLIFTAAMAIFSDEELISIIFLSIFSMILTALFIIYQAPDVALTEVVIGTGLTTAIFMATISQVREDEQCHCKEDDVV